MTVDGEVRIDQILFAWTNRTLTGYRGLGPVLTSLPTDAETAQWECRLMADRWAAVEADAQSRVPGLVYLRFGDKAAVVRKDAAADAHGRAGAPLAHAIVGPAAIVDHRIALGLSAWPGWLSTQPTGDVLDALAVSELLQAARSGYAALRDRARHADARLLASLLTAVLSDPGGQFSIYAADDSPIEANELMCGLVDVLGDIGGQPWTFSTAEREEPTSEDRPTIVFLTRPPGFSLRAPIGHRIRLGQSAQPGAPGSPAELDEFHLFGEALAEAYAWAGPGLINNLRTSPISSVTDAQAWAHKAQLVPGMLADVGYLLDAVAAGRMGSATVATLLARPDGIASELSGMSAESFGRLIRDWRRGQLAASQYPGITDALRAEAVRRCIAADRAPSSADVLALGSTTELCVDQLRSCIEEPRHLDLRGVFARMAAIVIGGGEKVIARYVADMPPAQVIALADECSAGWPALAAELLGALSRRHLTKADRPACARVLDERGFLVKAAERCHPSTPAAASQLLQALLTVLGPDLDRPEVIDRIIGHVKSSHSFPLLHALGSCVRDATLRQRIQIEAGQLAFADHNLPVLRLAEFPLSVAEAGPAVVPHVEPIAHGLTGSAASELTAPPHGESAKPPAGEVAEALPGDPAEPLPGDPAEPLPGELSDNDRADSPVKRRGRLRRGGKARKEPKHGPSSG